MQFCPFMQSFMQEPPQSVSASSPLVKPSLHAGAAHTFVIGLQKPLWQSLFPEHICPFTQSLGHGPPQSTSVSSPFFFVSSQAGTAQIIPVHT
jgi:hypothetical protein